MQRKCQIKLKTICTRLAASSNYSCELLCFSFHTQDFVLKSLIMQGKHEELGTDNSSVYNNAERTKYRGVYPLQFPASLVNNALVHWKVAYTGR